MTISLRKHIGQDRMIAVLAHTQKNKVARICGVDECTVRRWRANNDFPEYAARLIAVEAGYFPWPAFDGWQVIDDRLYSPTLRDGFTAMDIEKIPWIMAELKHLKELNSRPAQYYLI